MFASHADGWGFGVAVKRRSKSLESCKGVERRERRISWGTFGLDEEKGNGSKNLSNEAGRRHSVTGDLR